MRLGRASPWQRSELPQGGTLRREHKKISTHSNGYARSLPAIRHGRVDGGRKMKRWGLSTLVTCVALCVVSSKAPAVPQTTATKYAGTLPCADCAGIRTVLTLYSEPGPTRYELVETYLATRDGDRSFPSSGRWTVLRGSATDSNA